MNIETSTMMTALVLWPRIWGPPGATYLPSLGAGNLNTLNKVCLQVLEESGILPKESKIVGSN